MLPAARHKGPNLGAKSLLSPLRSLRYFSGTLPPSFREEDLEGSPEKKNAARIWISSFQAAKIEKSDVELWFARSSGPGGQNVNKVSTKAVVRCPLNSPFIPLWAGDNLRRSPAYVQSSHSLLVSSTQHRTQSENTQDCLDKLHGVILTAAQAPIKNDPTTDQQQRVKDLVNKYKIKLRKEKEHRGNVKKGRREAFGE